MRCSRNSCGKRPWMVSKGAFAAPASLRRAGQDVSDAQGAQGLGDLALLLLSRSLTGLLGAAEVGTAVSVQHAEAAVVAHRLKSAPGRWKACLPAPRTPHAECGHRHHPAPPPSLASVAPLSTGWGEASRWTSIPPIGRRSRRRR